jgi:hypothetical protein
LPATRRRRAVSRRAPSCRGRVDQLEAAALGELADFVDGEDQGAAVLGEYGDFTGGRGGLEDGRRFAIVQGRKALPALPRETKSSPLTEAVATFAGN